MHDEPKIAVAADSVAVLGTATKAAKARRPAMQRGVPPPLVEYYAILRTALGPQHWWPAESPFEVIVGAILTQNTAWVNVERAIANLRQAGMLSPEGLRRVNGKRLASLVRPSGYYKQKAKKLKAFVRFLYEDFQGSLEALFATPTAELRERLLAVHGIGPETADSILLYAGQHPVFVVDAYTRRLLERHGWMRGAAYDEVRGAFEANLPRDIECYNEFHALLVNVGKKWCRPGTPLCAECPLGPLLEEGR